MKSNLLDSFEKSGLGKSGPPFPQGPPAHAETEQHPADRTLQFPPSPVLLLAHFNLTLLLLVRLLSFVILNPSPHSVTSLG